VTAYVKHVRIVIIVVVAPTKKPLEREKGTTLPQFVTLQHLIKSVYDEAFARTNRPQ
jgi:hypothetical protein